MSRTMFFVIMASAIVLSAYAAKAGPFGVDVDGFALEKYGCMKTDGLYYTCLKVPTPHNEFETYVVRYHPDAGVCTIKGIGKDINENGFGTTTKEHVDKIYDQVSPKYGKLDKMDFLLPTSIWNESDEWLMGLVQNDRSYAYIGAVAPPIEGINTYGIMAGATSSDTGYVIVEFQTTNYDKCDVAEAKDGAASF